MAGFKKAHRVRLFSILVAFYMLAGFTWWVLLLRKKTDQYYNLQIEYLESKKLEDSAKQIELERIEGKHFRQEEMIIGEATVFGILLFIGLWGVYASYWRTLRVSKNQTNFLLAITHEFKTPIASISLILETLLKRKLNEAQKKRLSNDAMKETKRLNSMVNNLLLSARLDSKYSPYKESLNLCKICESIVEEYQYKHPGSSISIHCNKDLPSVYADREGLTAVIYNLLGNALKYCKNSPIINVSISHINKSLELRVEDNGIGIADAEKHNVFKRFYRSGNESTRKTKGTGLGLFIVKEIVQAHKGKIRIENNSPSGSVFIISLPIE